MKQSMNSGTLDNITCIFICFNNFRKIFQAKLNNMTSSSQREKDLGNTKEAFNIKNEYNENNNQVNNNVSSTEFYNPPQLNFEEIRRRLTLYKENSIRLRTNEYINFSNNEFQEKNFENKPKTSNEVLKNNTRFELDANSDVEYKPIITETENENNNNYIGSHKNDSKQLYKIVSKKNISPLNNNNYGKNYESNLPSFKIPQKLNKISKDINLRKLSPINKIGNIHNGFNSTTNINSVNLQMNMNNTSKGGNRFLPKITKNIGATTIYNEKKNQNNNSNIGIINNNGGNIISGNHHMPLSSHGSYKYYKPAQMNLKMNK